MFKFDPVLHRLEIKRRILDVEMSSGNGCPEVPGEFRTFGNAVRNLIFLC